MAHEAYTRFWQPPRPVVCLVGHQPLQEAFCAGLGRSENYNFVLKQAKDTLYKKKFGTQKRSYEEYVAKGILKNGWIEKHTEMVPSVIVVLAYWRGKDWEELELRLKEQIADIKERCPSNIACVVTLCNGINLPEDEDPKKLRRKIGLESKKSAIIAKEGRPGDIRSFEAVLEDLVTDFYKRKAHERGIIRRMIKNNLKTELCARNHFKIAFAYSFLGENVEMLKYYQSCYELLIRRVNEAKICGAEEKYHEIKEIAYIVIFKIIQLLLDQKNMTETVAQFNQHIENCRDLTTLDDLQFLHYKFMGVQFETMGHVLERFYSGTKISYAADFRRHPGYYFLTAAKWTSARQKAFSKVFTDPYAKSQLGLPMYVGQFCDTPKKTENYQFIRQGEFPRELMVDYFHIISGQLKKASELFKRTKRGVSVTHQQQYIQLRLAEESFAAGEYHEARTYISPLLKALEAEPGLWLELYCSIVQKALFCAKFLNDHDDIVRLCLIILRPGMTIKRSLAEEFQTTFLDALKNQVCSWHFPNSIVKLEAGFVKRKVEKGKEVKALVRLTVLLPVPLPIAKICVQMSNPDFNFDIDLDKAQSVAGTVEYSHTFPSMHEIGPYSILGCHLVISNEVVTQPEMVENGQFDGGLDGSARASDEVALYPTISVVTQISRVNLRVRSCSPALVQEDFPVVIDVYSGPDIIVNGVLRLRLPKSLTPCLLDMSSRTLLPLTTNKGQEEGQVVTEIRVPDTMPEQSLRIVFTVRAEFTMDTYIAGTLAYPNPVEEEPEIALTFSVPISVQPPFSISLDVFTFNRPFGSSPKTHQIVANHKSFVGVEVENCAPFPITLLHMEPPEEKILDSTPGVDPGVTLEPTETITNIYTLLPTRAGVLKLGDLTAVWKRSEWIETLGERKDEEEKKMTDDSKLSTPSPEASQSSSLWDEIRDILSEGHTFKVPFCVTDSDGVRRQLEVFGSSVELTTAQSDGDYWLSRGEIIDREFVISNYTKESRNITYTVKKENKWFCAGTLSAEFRLHPGDSETVRLKLVPLTTGLLQLPCVHLQGPEYDRTFQLGKVCVLETSD